MRCLVNRSNHIYLHYVRKKLLIAQEQTHKMYKKLRENHFHSGHMYYFPIVNNSNFIGSIWSVMCSICSIHFFYDFFWVEKESDFSDVFIFVFYKSIFRLCVFADKAKLHKNSVVYPQIPYNCVDLLIFVNEFNVITPFISLSPVHCFRLTFKHTAQMPWMCMWHATIKRLHEKWSDSICLWINNNEKINYDENQCDEHDFIWYIKRKEKTA